MSFIEILKQKYEGNIFYNQNIKKFTTWKIGGIAKYIVFPESKEKLINLINIINKYKISYYILGKGSNVLIGDDYYNGIIIYLGKHYNSYNLNKKNNIIYADSGLSLNKLGIICKNNNFIGMEFLRLIPGTLGGALITNAEAHGISIENFIRKVFLWHKKKIKCIEVNDCKFSYRNSVFQLLKKFLIIGIELKFEKGEKKIIEKNYKNAIRYRKKNQPKYPSAGSIFKNPKKNKSAGFIIDKLGLKGLKKNEITISPLHGNFILNLGNGKAKDVLYLIDLIQKKAKIKYGIDLELEIKKINC